MAINSVCISGNLTRDAELRQTQGGTSVLSFGVAVNERRKNNQTGEWEDYANFVDCAMFGNRAQALAQYLVKGTKVAVEGRLRYSSWERDGQRRSKLSVIAGELEFTGQRPAAVVTEHGGVTSIDMTGSVPPGVASAAQAAQQASMASAPLYDEDIPF